MLNGEHSLIARERMFPRLVGARGMVSGGLATGNPWPLDATGGRAVPLTQSEWNAVFDAAGVARKTVAHSHGFQDASGNITATVGTALTVTGTLDYRQTVSPYTRKGAAITETAAERAAYAAGVGVDPSTTSCIVWGLVDITAVGAALRDFLSITLNAANVKASIVQAGSIIRLTCNAVTSNGAVDHLTPGAFRIALSYNRAASAVAVYTTLEKIVGTYSAAVVDGAKGWGTTGTPPGCAVLWDSWFTGANGEWSEAEVRAVMRVLDGSTLPW